MDEEPPADPAYLLMLELGLIRPEPFPGCWPTPDDQGNYYAADDPERPF